MTDQSSVPVVRRCKDEFIDQVVRKDGWRSNAQSLLKSLIVKIEML